MGTAVGATVTPATVASSSRALSPVISVDLRRRLGALAGAPEMRDLILQEQQPVEQRLRRRRTPGHVDVHGDDAIDSLDDVIAVAEGTARVRARAHRHGPL